MIRSGEQHIGLSRNNRERPNIRARGYEGETVPVRAEICALENSSPCPRVKRRATGLDDHRADPRLRKSLAEWAPGRPAVAAQEKAGLGLMETGVDAPGCTEVKTGRVAWVNNERRARAKGTVVTVGPGFSAVGCLEKTVVGDRVGRVRVLWISKDGEDVVSEIDLSGSQIESGPSRSGIRALPELSARILVTVGGGVDCRCTFGMAEDSPDIPSVTDSQLNLCGCLRPSRTTIHRFINAV